MYAHLVCTWSGYYISKGTSAHLLWLQWNQWYRKCKYHSDATEHSDQSFPKTLTYSKYHQCVDANKSAVQTKIVVTVISWYMSHHCDHGSWWCIMIHNLVTKLNPLEKIPFIQTFNDVWTSHWRWPWTQQYNLCIRQSGLRWCTVQLCFAANTSTV